MATRPAAWPFANPNDMLMKARRDLGRLVAAEQALSRDDAIDCAINACVAAWHVADIVFARGLTARTDRGDFNTHLRNMSPEIHLCRDIAEFYKHLELKRSAASIETDGVSTGYGVNLNSTTYVLRGEDVALELNKKMPFSPPPEQKPPATHVPTPAIEDMDAEEVEATTLKPSRWLSVKIRLRNGNKRSAAEVVAKAIDDWDRLLSKGPL